MSFQNSALLLPIFTSINLYVFKFIKPKFSSRLLQGPTQLTMQSFTLGEFTKCLKFRFKLNTSVRQIA